MALGLVAANLGVALVPASAMALRHKGVVYRSLADLDIDITIQTILVWRREEISPLVQEFLAIVRDVLVQQHKTMIDGKGTEVPI